MSICADETFQSKATSLPKNASNKIVAWSSSNPEATIIDANGKVTGLAEGTVNITAAAEDGTKSAECVVTIHE